MVSCEKVLETPQAVLHFLRRPYCLRACCTTSMMQLYLARKTRVFEFFRWCGFSKCRVNRLCIYQFQNGAINLTSNFRVTRSLITMIIANVNRRGKEQTKKFAVQLPTLCIKKYNGALNGNKNIDTFIFHVVTIIYGVVNIDK